MWSLASLAYDPRGNRTYDDNQTTLTLSVTAFPKAVFPVSC